ncbi:hypothetical protein G7Y79_00007g021700 [Physcia stellaris]|nr:hypothetical protein G7Y79_00007g021700 [Physcia stellaris]
MASRKADEAKVRDWGFKHVFTWTDGPNAYYPPHKHTSLTTHLIRRGTLTIRYPDDGEPGKETFGVWMGDEGCEYVIGEM